MNRAETRTHARDVSARGHVALSHSRALRPAALLVVLPLVAACGQATDRTIVSGAAEALGGRDRVLAVNTMRLTGTGTHYNHGQDMRPGASGQTFTVTAYTMSWDLAGTRWRSELRRTPNFVYFQGPAEQRQIQGLDGDIGYNVNASSGAATRIGASATEDRRAEFHHHPVVLIRAALQPGTEIANERTAGGERLADLTLANGRQVTLAVDAQGLPTRVESRSYHPNLGDVTASTHFADYREQAGVRLPMKLTTRIDDFVISEIVGSAYEVNASVDLAAPAPAATAELPGPAKPNVEAELVAPGVWLLAGQSHHSALVELSDRLVLIEAPQSETRTLAVIAKARELQPAKPLGALVTTHHHFDHTAGLRAAIAAGMTIITHSGNRTFVEEMAARRHTITSDALAQQAQPLRIETVDAERVIADPARTMAIYHIADNPHSDTMVMVHLPAERVIIQVDAFSPGARANPYAANLLENIRKRKLAVDRVIPLHGPITPFAELVKVAETPPS
jgi:glyoxylase-like metal-dependent hydrolase (beta-lactamase superfamily II)